jgi:4-amino-4-deoxy-L-arabinose transferase-like glycosyltransferase
VYLLAAPTGLRWRLGQMFAGALATVVSGGWWVAIVALWPAGSRPFIDGSPDNNIFNLITGYNGLGRIFGTRGPGGGSGGQSFSGATGILRLSNDAMGGQASWLLLWGGWLVVSGVVFSFGSGVIHTYYAIALAQAIAALIAITGSVLWRTRHALGARAVMAFAVLLTASWSWVLLDRTPQWESWLRVLIPASAALVVIGLLAASTLRRLGRRASIATAVLALVACLSGPIAYSAQTITTAHTGSIPSAGPGSGMGGGGQGIAPGGHSALAEGPRPM